MCPFVKHVNMAVGREVIPSEGEKMRFDMPHIFPFAFMFKLRYIYIIFRDFDFYGYNVYTSAW